jgi:hypothetical protein
MHFQFGFGQRLHVWENLKKSGSKDVYLLIRRLGRKNFPLLVTGNIFIFKQMFFAFVFFIKGFMACAQLVLVGMIYLK